MLPAAAAAGRERRGATGAQRGSERQRVARASQQLRRALHQKTAKHASGAVMLQLLCVRGTLAVTV